MKRHRRGKAPGRDREVIVIRPIFHFSFQFIGVLAIGLAIALIAFFWRLSSGPISIAYFTPYFESALSDEVEKLRIKIDDTILTWAGVGRTLEIRLVGARALGADEKVVAEIPELAVSLSAAALMKGRLAPRTLTITGPSLKVIRNEAGQLDFGFGDGSKSGAGAVNDLARGVIGGLLQRSDGVRTIDYLARLNIQDAHVTIDDRHLGFVWEAPNANIVLRRTERGVAGETDLALNIEETSAAFKLNVDYDRSGKALAIGVEFADFNPSLLAGVSPKAALLGLANFPADGSAAFVTELDGALKFARFDVTAGSGTIGGGAAMPVKITVKGARLTGIYDGARELLDIENLSLDFGDEGRINLPAPIAHVMPVTSIALKGRYSKSVDRLDLENIAIDTPGPKVRGSAVFQEIGDELSITIDAAGDGFDTATRGRYWPASLAPVAREWIVKNITTGIIGDVRLRATAGWSKKYGFRINTLAGDLKGRGLSIDYFSPMPKIIEGDATAKFDQKRFDITVTSGRVNNTFIKSGRVLFTGLEQFDQFADIELFIDGPISEAVELLDGEPLDFARKFNLDRESARGWVATKLNLNFLVERAMTADAIAVKAVSRFEDIAVPGATFGFDMTGGNLGLKLDNKGMTVEGKAYLAGIAADFHWQEQFEKADVTTRYKIKAVLEEEDWIQNLGLQMPEPWRRLVRGPVAADLEIAIDEKGGGRLDARLGLKDAKIILEKFNWTKEAGTEAHAELTAGFSKDRFHNISRFTVAGGGLDMIGSVKFGAGGGAREFRVQRFRLADTDVAAVLIPVKNRWEIDVRGRSLDLQGFLGDDEDAVDGEPERGKLLSLSFSLGKALLEGGHVLGNVAGAAVFDGLVWSNAQFSGSINQDEEKAGKFDIKITPAGERRRFILTCDNAGAALKVLDFAENVAGGTLRIDGYYQSMMADSPLEGVLTVDKFRVLNAPVFARLLSIASLTGILEALGGEGLQFNQLVVPFVSGQDEVRVAEARATGLSLGVTATGSVNSKDDTMDIRGTLIPAYLINSALGRLPIVGPLFSGGQEGGGVFAAEFRVKGNVEKPHITTNPLTVLAPGFFRNFFKVFGSNEGGDAAPKYGTAPKKGTGAPE